MESALSHGWRKVGLRFLNSNLLDREVTRFENR